MNSSNYIFVFWVIALLVILSRAIYRSIRVEFDCSAKEKAFAASIEANRELMKAFNHEFATVKYKQGNLTFALHGILHSKQEPYSLESIQGSCSSMLYIEFGAGRIEKITQINSVVEVVLR